MITDKQRLSKLHDELGLAIFKIAEKTDIDVNKLYNLRSGSATALRGNDAIRLYQFSITMGVEDVK